MSEAIPTGTFGDAQPSQHRAQSGSRPWTTQEQLDHRHALDEALDGWEYAGETRTPHTTRHLRPVPETPAA